MSNSSINVKISTGTTEIEGLWIPTASQVEAAWPLLVELVTRVPINKMDNDEGSDEAAVASVYRLFALSREKLASGGQSLADARPGDLSLASLVAVLLNKCLRPFLTKWHHQLALDMTKQEPGVTASWPAHDQFRVELAELGTLLDGFVSVFAQACDAVEFVRHATE